MTIRTVPALLLGALICAAHAAPTSDQLIRQASALVAKGQLAQAEAMLRRDAAPNDFDAAAALGAVLRMEGKYPAAIAALTPAAEAGHAEAQYQLSAALAGATPPDQAGADRWLRRSAAGGNNKAKSMLNAPPTPVPDAQGRIKTADLKNALRSAIANKVGGTSDAVLHCYGASREQLVAYYDVSLDKCFGALPAADQERIAPSDALVRQLGSCATRDVIQQAGTTPEKLMACLPTKSGG